MAQATDYVLANQSGSSFRAELNSVLAAIVSFNSGSTEPTTRYAFQPWVDTGVTPALLKIRNAANSAWITIGDVTATNLGLLSAATASSTYAPLASPSLTGAIYANGSYRGNITAVSALNIDCSAGNYFTKTIAASSTFTVSNVPASLAYAFTLELTHTSGTITWFSGVVWPSGTAPTLTTGKVHLFMFITDDGGTTWRASSLINY